MPLPKPPVTYPADVLQYDNGRLPGKLLVAVQGAGGTVGKLHRRVAAEWKHLVLLAAQDGITLTFTNGGTYRDYDAQERLFRERYSPEVLRGHPRKRWGARYWYLRTNPATGHLFAEAATPGESNHGRAVAIDTAEAHGLQVVSLTDRTVDWMLDHLPPLGWGWELEKERWHIRWTKGDGGSAPAMPPPGRMDNVNRFIRVDGTDAVWHSTNAQILTWVPTPQELDRKYAVLRANGVEPGPVHVVANRTDWAAWGDVWGPTPPGW